MQVSYFSIFLSKLECSWIFHGAMDWSRECLNAVVSSRLVFLLGLLISVLNCSYSRRLQFADQLSLLSFFPCNESILLGFSVNTLLWSKPRKIGTES